MFGCELLKEGKHSKGEGKQDVSRGGGADRLLVEGEGQTYC